ncbi:hypothetical protein TB2_007404 [Malus domestica]
MSVANEFFKENVINSVAAGGFVVRNVLRNLLIVGALNLGHNTINGAEALALREAIYWVKRKNFSHIIVEGDSKLIIDDVQGKCEMPWNLRRILDDV